MNLTSRADVLAALREHRIDPQQARLLLQQLDSVPTQQEEYETSVNSVTRSDSIAIIGMSGRYASAANLEEYWDLIANGRDGVRALPARFAGASVDEVATPRIGYLDDVDAFDPAYFQVPYAEARAIDPQHRLFMQEGARALQDAGYSRARVSGRRCGVYLGLANGDYLILADREGSTGATVTSSSNAIAAGRVSYFYDLKGPALTLDTACSSSLVALHLAVAALRAGEIDMAVVGGAATYLSVDGLADMAAAGMLSPTGACRAFSDDADGFVPGEGAGAVVLRRLADAEADGDHIHAVILGSGINQDGRTNGITAPNLASQRALVQEIYERGQIDPRGITYAEMHGTGTVLGDPIELEALAGAFRTWTSDTGFCTIGSVKSNVGHTSAAAGMASLQKIVLCMQHGEFVPTLHAGTLNHHFDFAQSPFVVGTERRPWLSDGPRRAAVSSFGFSGTNAHAVVEEYVPKSIRREPMADSALLVLSAHQESQLREMARVLAEALERDASLDLRDVALTLQRGRDALPERAATVASDRQDAIRLLHGFAVGDSSGWHRGRATRARRDDSSETSTLGELASAWVDGQTLAWDRFEQTQEGRTVSLPPYPFEQVPLWFEPGGKHRGGPAETTHVIRLETDDWRLREHRINGVGVLPGAASAELLWQWLAQQGKHTALSDIVWSHPLTSSGQPLTLRLTQDGAGALTIATDDGTCVSARRTSWREPFQSLVPAENTFSVPALRGVAPGVEYGPRFGLLRDVRVTDDAAIGNLAVTGEADWAGILDSAWQAVGPLLPVDHSYVPLTADRIDVWGSPDRARRVYVARSSQDSASFNVDIIGEGGELLLATQGLTFAALDGRDFDKMAFVMTWRDRPLFASTRTRVALLNQDFDSALWTGAVDLGTPTDCDGACWVLPTREENASDALETVGLCHTTLMSLLADREATRRLIVVDTSGGTSATAAAVSGYLKTVRLETSMKTTLLSVTNLDEAPAAVAAEIAADDIQVCVRDGLRQVAEFAESEIPESEWGAETALVVGGSSGVGALIAAAVVEAGGRAAILSRSGEPAQLPSWASAAPDRVLYLRGDVTSREDVSCAVAEIHERWGALDAVYHAAAVLSDSMLRGITAEQLSAVWGPKAVGFEVLDEILADEPLRHFTVCSSLSAWIGNPGQAAYCAANAYVDGAVHHREKLRRAGERHGQSVSIAWPYWADGGMRISDEAIAALKRDLGMIPLPRAIGVGLFPSLIATGQPAIACGVGSAGGMRKALISGQDQPSALEQTVAVQGHALAVAAAQMIREAICEGTGTPEERVRLDDSFEDLGLDSIVIMTVTRKLETRFGSLPKTLFFEHVTIEELAYTLATKYPAVCGELEESVAANIPLAGPAVSAVTPVRCSDRIDEGQVGPQTRDIAIIGMSGRFPGGDSLDEFWNSLRQGRDCITEIPSGRWDHRRYTGKPGEPGKTPARWGGFINDVDKFDPLFFGISPAEADFMDPQARLFLQECWHACEDAGYTRKALSREKVGVFVGVMYGHYGLLRGSIDGHSVPVPSSFAAIANRVSHALDLHGPTIALDTMCSSSLTALHLAINSIRSGESDLALAGGVNLTIHPDKLVLLSQGKFASLDGRCRAFGQGGTGYVPGEGVGAFLLKPLASAIDDGDHIWGVIRGSAINAGGHAGGFTVPSTAAQADVIRAALADGHVDPGTVSYVEAHGTGTELGDPIEVRGLAEVFGPSHLAQPCLVGSVKSNIGHCESAAGVASLVKVLLQMRHRTLVPSLHADPLNSYIDFEQAHVEVVRSEKPWDAPMPLRAGISSFGAGGANAHLVVEEAPEGTPRGGEPAHPMVVVLSARDEERLENVIDEFVNAAQKTPDLRLSDVAFTLQTGREALPQRCAIVTADLADAVSQLVAFRSGMPSQVMTGRAARAQSSLERDPSAPDEALALLAEGDLHQIARRWVEGLAIDWSAMWQGDRPRRVSLPGYPFSRETCWVTPPKEASARLHPLVHENCSTLEGVAFRTHLDPREPLLRDHLVSGTAILPGAVMIEMLHAAGCLSFSQPVTLSGIVFSRPCPAAEATDLTIHVEPRGDRAHIRITSAHDQNEVEYCDAMVEPELHNNRAVCAAVLSPGERRTIPVEELYSALVEAGLEYGATLRTVRSVQVNATESVATVRRNVVLEGTLLDPAMIDGALQSTWAFLQQSEDGCAGQKLPFAIQRVEILADTLPDSVTVVSTAAANTPTDESGVDIAVCNDQGEILVNMLGVRFHAVDAVERPEVVLLVPTWQSVSMPDHSGTDNPPHRILFTTYEELCYETPEVDATLLYTGSARDTEFMTAATQVTRVLREADGRNGDTLVQLVVSEDSMLAGLFPLLRTVAAEEGFDAQLMLCPPATDPAVIAAWSREEARVQRPDQVVRRTEHAREVESLSEFVRPVAPDVAVDGVWLISGGAGGVGRLIAEDLAFRARRHGSIVRLILLGRRNSSPDIEEFTGRLTGGGVVCTYESVDITDAAAVRALVVRVSAEHGAVTDVIHAAGVVHDGLHAAKSEETIQKVLAPKVLGTLALHDAVADQPLRSFMLCSSLAASIANPGQADYAAANGFEDSFALWRAAAVRRGEARGHSVSVGWPLWAHAGMGLAPAAAARMTAQTGLVPLPTETALDLFHALRLQSPARVLPLIGDPTRIRSFVARARRNGDDPQETESGNQGVANEQLVMGAHDSISSDDLAEKLRDILADLIRVDRRRLDLDEPLEAYGVDSVVIIDFAERLRPTMGRVSKSVFFDSRSLRELAQHLMVSHPEGSASLVGSAAIQPDTSSTPMEVSAVTVASGVVVEATDSRQTGESTSPEQFAIVGMAGRYPKASNVAEFWDNLWHGRDSIDRIPSSRWQQWGAPVYPDDFGLGWAGMLEDADCFDDRFFAVAPSEAEVMDPQERILLECAHHAIEDSGHRPDNLAGRQADGSLAVGVYVGAMYSEYQLYGAQSQMGSNGYALNGVPAALSNRISYTYGFGGPSMTVDSMCSSSLTALHVACQALRRGDCEVALVGGVNLSVHPNKFRLLRASGFTSPHGRCKAFSADAAGYVPSEGVGVLVVKPLAQALADGDHVYGVVAATSLGHGGRSNGFTVPRPAAQAHVVNEALLQAGLSGADVDYVEAHGTGTRLGDPLEIDALFRALGAERSQPCLVGSVKSNIGHCESAAGMASVTKVLLQMQHETLVPSIHADELNPDIEWESVGMEVVRELRPWPSNRRRVAGVSAFGAGGSNAHVILTSAPVVQEEYSPNCDVVELPLSACRPGDLAAIARQLQEWLRGKQLTSTELADVAYTYQVGRMPLEHRVLLVAHDQQELECALASVSRGSTSSSQPVSLEGQAWLAGESVAWQFDPQRRRISLPGYPFARRRHWRPEPWTQVQAAQEVTLVPVHALVHRNVSSMFTQCYESDFGPDTPVVADHRVQGVPVLAGAASLELMAVATGLGLEAPVTRFTHVAWSSLVSLAEPVTLQTSLVPEVDGLAVDVRFGATVAASAIADLDDESPSLERIDLDALRRRCGSPAPADAVISRLEALGLTHGQSYRQLVACSAASDEVLAVIGSTAGDGHPSLAAMLNAAFECCVLLGREPGLWLPFAADSVRFAAMDLPAQIYAHVRRRVTSSTAFVADVALANESGDVLVRVDGLALREVKETSHV